MNKLRLILIATIMQVSSGIASECDGSDLPTNLDSREKLFLDLSFSNENNTIYKHTETRKKSNFSMLIDPSLGKIVSINSTIFTDAAHIFPAGNVSPRMYDTQYDFAKRDPKSWDKVRKKFNLSKIPSTLKNDLLIYYYDNVDISSLDNFSSMYNSSDCKIFRASSGNEIDNTIALVTKKSMNFCISTSVFIHYGLSNVKKYVNLLDSQKVKNNYEMKFFFDIMYRSENYVPIGIGRCELMEILAKP